MYLNTDMNDTLDNLNDFSMEIMNDIGAGGEDDHMDFSTFDDAFDDPIEVMAGLLEIEIESSQRSNGNPDSVDSSSLSGDEAMDESEPIYNEYFDTHSHPFADDFNTIDVVDSPSRPQEQVVKHESVQDAQQYRNPNELDEQIKASMSMLVQSMHRSEMSRNMLHGQQQSSGRLGNLFNQYSSIASGIAQSRTQLSSYMNNATSTL
jgi:hypothetical protein